MAHYFNFNLIRDGVLLHHSDGIDFCPTVYAAEQKLLASINYWAAENKKYAEEEMEILSRVLRESR